MILYGDSPSALAQQQAQYDQLYNNSNMANRAAASEAQARNIQLMLSQQRADEAARQHDEDVANQFAVLNQRQNFDAGQSALDRASRNLNTFTQYNSTHRDRVDNLLADKFKEAQAAAEKGLLPDDLSKVKTQYGLDDAGVASLASINSNAKLGIFKTELERQLKNNGAASPTLVDSFFTKGTPIHSQAQDYYNTVLNPLDSEFSSLKSKAAKGNLALKIAADVNAPKLDESVSGSSWYNPVSWLMRGGQKLISPASNPDAIVPRGDWQTRAAGIVASLQDPKQPSGLEMDAASGQFSPQMLNPRGGDIQSVQPLAPAASIPAPPVTAPSFTPDIALTYLRKYGNRAAAEAAARRDGFVW